MPFTLHPYQQEAVDHLHAHDRAALFLDMGLGKTAIVLSALTEQHLPVLVTAPKRVAENVWAKERSIWRPDLTVAVACGSKAKREEALNSDADIIVIGRDNLADAIPMASKFSTFVIDELSGFKNARTRRWKAAYKIAAQTQHFWGLTGTPAPNGMIDVWAQAFLIDFGARLGKTLGGYRARYFIPGRQIAGGTVVEWKLRPHAADTIFAKLSDVCISMSADDKLDLPPFTLNTVEVTLPSAAKRAYMDMKTSLVAKLDDMTFTATNAAVLTSKLSQITAGCVYNDADDDALEPGGYTELHREKINAVREIVEGTGSPVLIFYRYKFELEQLLAEFGDLAHTVDEPDLQERWNNGEFPILLAHPASAGHGLNLQHGGHTIIWTSLPWSLEEWEQANRRLTRQGQTDPVIAHVLTVPGTVDESIRTRLVEKTSVQDALLDALEK